MDSNIWGLLHKNGLSPNRFLLLAGKSCERMRLEKFSMYERIAPTITRCSSGCAGLDDVLGGGLPIGHFYLIEGEPARQDAPCSAINGRRNETRRKGPLRHFV